MPLVNDLDKIIQHHHHHHPRASSASAAGNDDDTATAAAATKIEHKLNHSRNVETIFPLLVVVTN